MEAIRNCSKKFDRSVFFKHNKVIIISENLAEDGIIPILDVFTRGYETRPSVWLVISKNTDASKILQVNHGINSIQALYLEDIINNKQITSEVQANNLLDFYKDMLRKGTNPTVAAMEIVTDSKNSKNGDNKEISLSGIAAFKKDKLIGYLTGKETRGYNWITNQVKGGVINVSGINNTSKLIANEIKRSTSRIKSEIVDENYIFNINVTELGVISEVQDTSDVTDLEIQSKIQDEIEKQIEDEIKLAINKAQNDFKCDIFGFGNVLYKSHPKQWNKVKNNWNEVFTHAKFKINVKATYRRTGEKLKPLNTRE